MANTTQNFEYTNETFSGCDMVASITIKNGDKTYSKIVGELQTVSYSIHMEKRPVRSIGNVNAKDYVMGPRTIAGSLVFSVFNKHFSQDLMEGLNKDNAAGTVYLVDEIPPFDIVISAANEYGYRSRMVIYGIRLLNEGQVMSVNDVYTENTYQFFATDLEYLTDEMYYTKSAGDRLYKLTDAIPFTDMTNMNLYTDVNYAKTEQQKQDEFWAKRTLDKISLTSSIKQPKKAKGNGIVDFFLKPGQKEGTIYVTNSDDDTFKVNVKADASKGQDNLQTYASRKFESGTYTAYFENTAGTKSNKIKFIVSEYVSGNMKLTTPTLSKLTSKSVIVQSSNSKHNKVLLCNLSNGNTHSYSLNNKKCKLTGLSENTTYTIKTFSSDDNDSSKVIQFKTLGDFQAYEDLINYLKANKKTLSISSISDYTAIINASKDPDLTPYDSIDNLKSTYKNDLACLDLGSSSYKEDKKDLEKSINICNDILKIAQKMNNNITTAINKTNNVPAPIHFYDENYDDIFQFDENIESAEFFRVYGAAEQYATTANSYAFKAIDNKPNCYKFVGKPGVNHYVQAIIDNVRSSKVEFYVMTQIEKQQYINKQSKTDKLNVDDVTKITDTVTNDLANLISTLDEQRAFMVRAKKISNDTIMTPAVISIEDTITVETFLSNFPSNPNTFYLAVATYDDVVNNKDIYKVPFTCANETVIISPLYNGLKENTAYAIWIEDSNNIQISNATSFSYITGTDIADDITEYAVKDFIDAINVIAQRDLSVDMQETIKGTIEHNDGITTNEIISSVIDIVVTNVMPIATLLNFLYLIKKYIGILIDCDTSFLTNIKYTTSEVTFDTTHAGTVLIYDLDQIKTKTLTPGNSVLLSDYQANILVMVAVDNSFNSKSNIIVINKAERYMEVL